MAYGGKARRKETTRKTEMHVGGYYYDGSQIGRGGRDWIDLAKDRDQWRALVDTSMNLRIL
jgi:hypothetical protein